MSLGYVTSTTASPWRLTFVGLLRSEARKLTSMASTWVLIGLSFLLGLMATALFNNLVTAGVTSLDLPYGSVFNRVSATMSSAPVFPGALMALLGILAVTNEYGSGMIRTTLSVAPARWPALTAKAVLVGGCAFVTALVGEFLGAVLAWLPHQAVMQFDLFTPGGLHVWFGSSLVVLLFSLMGLATGVLVRSTAVAVLTLHLGVLMVLPWVLALALINASSGQVLLYLPSSAAVFVYIGPVIGVDTAPVMSTGAAIVTMLCWTLIPLGGAYARFQFSD